MTYKLGVSISRLRLVVRTLVVPLASLAGAAVFFIASTSPVRASECVGAQMPDQIEIGSTKLVLNGMGIRRATVFTIKVYVGALYLPTRTSSAQKVLSKAMAKRLVLYFVRDVDRDEMGEAIKEGIRKNSGKKVQAALKKVAQVTRLFPPLRKGTNLIFTYLPDKGLEIRANNVLKGTLKDDDFTQLLFRVWFGPKPPDRALKSGMLGAKCE